MKISELIFVGIKGSVVALNRDTGEQIWVRRLKGIDFVNIVLEDKWILASTYGEIYCLEAATGEVLWHNRLKGFGIGLATIATPKSGPGSTSVLAEKRRRDEESAAAASAVTTA